MTGTSALNAAVLDSADRIRATFRSVEDLADFVVIPDFLAPEFFTAVQTYARTASLLPFCVFSRTPHADVLETRFGEPEEDFYYVSCHRRLPPGCRVPPEIDARMGSTETRAAINALTGLDVTSCGDPSTLTGWNPGDFLGEHCDQGTAGRQTRLIVSVSLTEGWSTDYGGVTHFRWLGGDREVVVNPRSNTATLFRAGPHSVHWVAPVSLDAPTGKRFTWTLHYY